MSGYPLNLFVSHSFHDEHHPIGVTAFRQCIGDAVTAATASSGGTTDDDFTITAYFDDARSGMLLPAQVRSELLAADIVLVDTTGLSPNVFYELGFSHALRRKLILVQCKDITPEIPTDIKDILVGRYRELDELRSHVETRLRQILHEIAGELRRGTFEAPDRCFWFGQSPTDLHIVCAPEPEMSRFADPSAENYLFVDSLEDRDALMEVAMFLSRSHPNARVLRHSSGSVTPDVLESSLVVLGGPFNNLVTRDLMQALNIPLTYDINDYKVVFEPAHERHELELIRDRSRNGLITKDVGYFGRFINPFNARHHVVLCQGFHTFGTLGAAMILADGSQAMANRRWFLSQLSADDLRNSERLQLFFHVDVLASRRIVVPRAETAYLSWQ
jgi:hypothetical protein